jgi:signal transduction histidine kinase
VHLKRILIPIMVAVIPALALHLTLERALEGSRVLLGVHPEVRSLLEASQEDQRTLAELRPDDSLKYRQRFESVEATLGHLRVVDHSRRSIARRASAAVTVVTAVALLLAAGGYQLRQERDRLRLDRLQHYLERLSAGETDLVIGDGRRDAIGSIATMVEKTSRAIAHDRRRLAALKHLAAWQEAARRQAHEMRTPLTAARLELEHLRKRGDGGVESCASLIAGVDSIGHEVERLASMVRDMTSFARLPRPKLQPIDLGALLREYVETFSDAWQPMRLELAEVVEGTAASVDRDLVREVLTILCDNAARALAEEPGVTRISAVSSPSGDAVVRVADSGPGVRDDVLDRLFEPYATTRGVGEGMGLGLAIARKIMLEHGGDIELESTSPGGSVFRLVFPAIEGGEA